MDLGKGDLVDGVVVVMLFLLGIIDIFASYCLLAATMYCTYLPMHNILHFNVGEPGGEGGIFRSSPHLRYWKVFHMRQDPIHIRQ